MNKGMLTFFCGKMGAVKSTKSLDIAQENNAVLLSEVEAPHNLVYIDLPNEICFEQIKKRRIEQPKRAVTDTAEMFEQVTKYFVEPTLSPESTLHAVALVEEGVRNTDIRKIQRSTSAAGNSFFPTA